MKKLLLLFSLILSACSPSVTSMLSINSDLSNVPVKEKNIYYELKDSSVIAARINRVIRQRLKETGWTIHTDPKSANYSYSITTDKKEFVQNYLSNIGGTTYLTQQRESFPIAFFIIQNAITKENIYEAAIVLSSNYEFGALEKFTKVAAPALFLKEDKKWDIECEIIYPENEKEYESCVLKVPNE